VKLILAAGAVATALGAIIALAQAIWPDPPKPAERLSATISELQVDPKVPLAEYLEERPDAGRDARRTASVSRQVFAAASVAQSSTPMVITDPPPPPRTPDPPPPPTTPDPPPPTTTSTTADPPTTTSTTPAGEPPPPPQTGARDRRIVTLLSEVETRPIQDVLALTTDPSEPVPTTAMMQFVDQIVVDDGDAPPQEVRQVLASSRLQLTRSPGAPQKLSPLGVVVNFRAEIEGFRGKRSVVRWSLFDARQGTRMPQPWLRNRRALTLIPEAGKDGGTPAVWVPLPRKRGPYFVRLELLDDRGTRLAKADTESFDR
jgi:hypothetical protein